MNRIGLSLLSTCALTLAVTPTAVTAQSFSEWSTPVSAEQGSHPSLNTPFLEGCPNLSPDGLTLYFASNRNGFVGQAEGRPRNIDIWIAQRPDTTSGWGEPVNLGQPINSTSNELCPTPVQLQGKSLFFVSEQTGDGDIYFTRQGDDGLWIAGLWQVPFALSADINSQAAEASPSYFQDELGRWVLYFSSARTGRHDIYQTVNFQWAEPAPGALNTDFGDARPSVSRNGLEIVFDSDRPGGLGDFDIWTARRASTNDPWPEATHVANVNSSARDFRPALSSDGTVMVFGSTRLGGEGSQDIYVTTRRILAGTPSAVSPNTAEEEQASDADTQAGWE